MGPVPGSETQISRKKNLIVLIGVRIFLGLFMPLPPKPWTEWWDYSSFSCRSLQLSVAFTLAPPNTHAFFLLPTRSTTSPRNVQCMWGMHVKLDVSVLWLSCVLRRPPYRHGFPTHITSQPDAGHLPSRSGLVHNSRSQRPRGSSNGSNMQHMGVGPMSPSTRPGLRKSSIARIGSHLMNARRAPGTVPHKNLPIQKTIMEGSFTIGRACAALEMSRTRNELHYGVAGGLTKKGDQNCRLSGNFRRLAPCSEAAIGGIWRDEPPQLVAGVRGAPSPQRAPN